MVYVNGVVKSADESTATMDGTTNIYKNIAEGATVIIADTEITSSGKFMMDGVDVTANGTTNKLSFVMSKDVALTDVPAAGDSLHTITAGRGIVLKGADGQRNYWSCDRWAP